MRALIFSAIFLLAMHTPLFAEKTVFLNDLSKKNQMGYTRLILDFSSLPTCQVRTYGQRVDLHFQGVELGPKFRQLPEDDAIVRVILAQNKTNLVLSILFRKLPVKVETTSMASKDQLYVDVYWQRRESRAVRLAVDMHTQGLPQKSGNGRARVEEQESPYVNNWKKFFHNYQAPLEVKVPVRFSLPELPVFPEQLAHEELKDVFGVIRSEGWEVLEALLTMKAETNSELKKNDVFQALLMETRFRTGNYKAVLDEAFEPEETLLRSRCRYLKNFSWAVSGRFHLAKSNLDRELGQMENDNPFRAHVLLLQAEIALARDSQQEALQYLSQTGVVWAADMRDIRRLRLIDSQKFEIAPEKKSSPPLPTVVKAEEKTEIMTIPAQTVVVQKGDSWWGLSRRLATTVKELKKLNNMSGNMLQIGQTLTVSAAQTVKTQKAVPPVKKPVKTEPLNPYSDFLKERGVFLKKPYSLYRAANFFQKQGRPNAALFLLENAKLLLEEGEAKQLIDFSIACLLIEVGKKDMGLERLTYLAEQEPVTDVVLRAHIALLEEQMEEKKDFDFLSMATEYGAVVDQACNRELREAAAFKSALALYFAGKKEQSVHSFDAFRKNYSAGGLVGEVDAFLSEKLPSLIEEMVTQGRDFDAVLMLDKHREILLSHQKNSTFLVYLADSMGRLGLMNRAAKIYLFLLDYYRDKDQEKLFYLPLVNTYMERQEFASAADFAGRYLERFPEGRDSQELFYLQISAYQKAMRLDEAVTAWEKHHRLAGRKERIVMAQVFWEKKRYQDVVDCLEVGTAGDENYPAEILILKAESYLKERQARKAFTLFKELSVAEEYSQHSLYRCAQIALAAGRESEALNYLSQVVEKGKSGVWSDLAKTSLTEMRM